MSTTLTLYDIACSLPGRTFSPNVAKVKYALAYKGIPYETVWLEYPEIEPVCQKIGATPTSKTAPQYTLPVIYDPLTATVVSDSLEIALYLDATYPDTPRLIPEATASLHYAFTEAHLGTIGALLAYALPATLPLLNAASQEYFRRTKSREFGGQRLEDVFPTGDRDVVMWKQFKEGLDRVDGWITNGRGGKPGKYFMGDFICYADITIAGWLYWVRLVLVKEKWEDILSWHGGRWARLMEEVDEFDVV